MARGDGIHRTNARSMRLTAARIGNAQQHNEREKGSYVNQDIVPERTHLNVHFKKPAAGYAEMFEQLKKDGIISTRGLKEDAFLYGELVFDVNTAYFHNHGGYDFAKQFYTDAYKSAIEIVGGEQYNILSAVMHADARNRAMSDARSRTCTTITFMWSTFPSWKSKSCGRNAARINHWLGQLRKRYSRSV